VRRLFAVLLIAVLVAVAAALAPAMWTRSASAGYLYTESSAPTADVAIVFGAQVAPGGQRPMPFLAGRLDTGADLLNRGKARALLISGDGAGSSGDEVRVMRDYLAAQGVPDGRVVSDPHGRDTYDTCRRAREVYGVTRALLVSQSLHLHRAVTLCRAQGIDAYGVAARCDGCRKRTLLLNRARELATGPKAVLDIVRDRAAAVQSPPDTSLRDAVRA
jgi:vancomycin permeability regulator SanA